MKNDFLKFNAVLSNNTANTYMPQSKTNKTIRMKKSYSKK